MKTHIVDTELLLIWTLHVTMPSAIKIGLTCALREWIKVGDYLSELLGAEGLFLQPDEHDEFCFYDHNDFSQSKKCFWIINSVDRFHQSIQDIIYQWDWFYKTYVKYLNDKPVHNDENRVDQMLRTLRRDIRGLLQI